MQAISKIIKRSPLERKKRLLLPVAFYPGLAWLALFIIAGLEIYFLNRDSDSNTFYPIGGFGTLSYGGMLITVFFKQRQNISRLVAFSRTQGGLIEEGVVLDDEGLNNFITGYYSQRLEWSALSRYQNRRHYIEINIAGITFLLSKHYFSDNELEHINELLRSKLIDPHKRFFESAPPYLPPRPLKHDQNNEPNNKGCSEGEARTFDCAHS